MDIAHWSSPAPVFFFIIFFCPRGAKCSELASARYELGTAARRSFPPDVLIAMVLAGAMRDSPAANRRAEGRAPSWTLGERRAHHSPPRELSFERSSLLLTEKSRISKCSIFYLCTLANLWSLFLCVLSVTPHTANRFLPLNSAVFVSRLADFRLTWSV